MTALYWTAPPVPVELAIALSRAVHDRCSNVPHDIGITLMEVINDYSDRNSELKQAAMNISEITMDARFDDTGHDEPWRNQVAFELNIILIAANVDKADGGHFFPKAALAICARVAQFEEIQVKP